jgi:hypothetical protein
LKRLAESDHLTIDNLISAIQTQPEPDNQDDLNQLVGLIHEFSAMGEAERETGLKILATFVEYGRHQRQMKIGANR